MHRIVHRFINASMLACSLTAVAVTVETVRKPQIGLPAASVKNHHSLIELHSTTNEQLLALTIWHQCRPTETSTEFRCGGRFYFTVFCSLSTNPKVKQLLK